MKKLLVNITSLIGSGNAEHYYASTVELDVDTNIYDLARMGYNTHEGVRDELERELKDPKEVQYLNKKDGDRSTHRVGRRTSRFISPDQIKKTVESQYPTHDIVFFKDGEMRSEDLDVIERNPSPVKKIGRKIRISGFEGFSSEFVNLIEGSIHECLERPERYKNKELQDGEWVWGVTEPVLVLRREFNYIES